MESSCATEAGPVGSVQAVELFHRAAAEVPAYRQFLADNGIRAEEIRTAADFAAVPAVTKANYLRRYPLPEQLWHGDITRAGTWSTSSGSTGEPTYWPRDRVSLADSVTMYDRIFRACFETDRRSTLLVIGFALGNWIGGTYTYRAALELRDRGHRVSVVAPGIDIDTILRDITDLGPHYDQVVLAGYPPFVKDVLDQAGPRVRGRELRLLLAGENITEQWRAHILDRIGRPGEPWRVCLMYGTADAGVMGYETPLTIAIRRLAHQDSRLAEELFGGGAALPTFVEYDPRLRYTEVDADGRFLFTVDSTLPLIRYRINDEGTILTPARLAETLRRHGHRLPADDFRPDTGFLALRRRADVAASFYAVKLYPESIRAALEDPVIRTLVSGKFVLSTEIGDTFTQTLCLRVEMRPGVEPPPGFADLIAHRVTATLDRTNGEYRKLRATLGPAAEVAVAVDPFGGDRFRYDIKHTYVESGG
ncbi:phenylacetate--CoA ligase family protein [Nocardia sp. NPDC003482]